MQNPTNRQRYDDEKAQRWGMASQSEESAIIQIMDLIKEQLGNYLQDISYIRYDEIVHKKFPPENHEWAKGCPDYLIKAMIKNSNNQSQYLLFEIKLKAEQYRKTITGGETRNGTNITKYNCPSYYLDIVPVLRNMNDFCEHTQLDKLSFIVAFVPMNKDNIIDTDDIMVASLWRINYILEHGWFYLDDTDNDKKVEFTICEYGEGYGQVAYLIPKSATTNLKAITAEMFLTRLEIANNLKYL